MATETTLNWDAEDIKAFIEGLTLQHSIYSRMLQLTETQLAALSEDNSADIINNMLAQKQPLVHELETAEGQIAERKRQWPKVRESLPQNIAKFTQDKLAQMQQTLKKLIDQETAVSEIVQQGLAQGRQKLGEISRKNQATRAYTQPKAPTPRFLNDQT